MDNSKSYAGMCEKASEIQSLWPLPRQGMPDLIYTHSAIVYKRIIRHDTSRFVAYDYSKEYPQWLGLDKELGFLFAKDIGTNNLNKYHTAFNKVDESFPGIEVLIQTGEAAAGLEHEQWIPREQCIWLPRQDQLQEIVHAEGQLAIVNVMSELPLFARSLAFDGDWRWISETWEQLWLAFVMSREYNKFWNGTDWVTK
jgi:hypothetical protein